MHFFIMNIISIYIYIDIDIDIDFDIDMICYDTIQHHII